MVSCLVTKYQTDCQSLEPFRSIFTNFVNAMLESLLKPPKLRFTTFFKNYSLVKVEKVESRKPYGPEFVVDEYADII